MAQRKDRRARSRKRRADGGRAGAQVGSATGLAEPAQPKADEGTFHQAVKQAKRTPRQARSGPVKPERPRPPWHPLPLAEILILAGSVAFFIGMHRGMTTHAARTPLLVGIAAVSAGTLEFTLREHRSGFRSHTILLAVLPLVVVDTVAVLVIAAFTTVGSTAKLVILGIDVVLFLLLFRLLRGEFVQARYEQTTRRQPPRRPA